MWDFFLYYCSRAWFSDFSCSLSYFSYSFRKIFPMCVRVELQKLPNKCSLLFSCPTWFLLSTAFISALIILHHKFWGLGYTNICWAGRGWGRQDALGSSTFLWYFIRTYLTNFWYYFSIVYSVYLFFSSVSNIPWSILCRSDLFVLNLYYYGFITERFYFLQLWWFCWG